MLDAHRCTWASLQLRRPGSSCFSRWEAREWGRSGLESCRCRAPERRLNRRASACGVFPAQGLNPRLPRRQADSLPPKQPGKLPLCLVFLSSHIASLQQCYYLFIISKFYDYTKAFDCVDHSKLWKILKEMGIPDHLTCLLRNLYAGQEATVRTGHGPTDWF